MNPKIEAIIHSLNHSDLYIGHWRISSSSHPEEPLEYRISKKDQVIFIDVGCGVTCLDGDEIRTFSTWSDQQLCDSGNADYQVKSLSGASLLGSPVSSSTKPTSLNAMSTSFSRRRNIRPCSPSLADDALSHCS